jgi:hypothetical protein
MLASVIQRERSDASRATTSATSSGDPRRPSGTDCANTSAAAPVASLNALRASSPPGVITGPGDTTFTRMPWASTVGRTPWGVALSGGRTCVRFHYMVRGSAWPSVDTTDAPDVALSGDGSEASFSHAFRQWAGVAPGAWRRRVVAA